VFKIKDDEIFSLKKKIGLTIAISSLFPPRALCEFPSEQICQFAVLGAALVIIYLILFLLVSKLITSDEGSSPALGTFLLLN